MHRTWNKKLAGAVLLSLAVIAGTAEAKPAEPINDIQAVADEQMTVMQINETIRANCPSVIDLEAIAEETDGQWVRERIASYTLPQNVLYSRGKRIAEKDRQELLDNMDIDRIGEMQAVGYGVAVRRANVRGVPMGRGLFAAEGEMERDVLQQGTLDPCETVRLLHISKDKRYYFVQGQTICGWVFIGDIAVAKKNVWLTYHAPNEFVTVISRGERIKHDEETVYAQMGTRLPLMREKNNKYKVRLPMRGNHGKLIDIQTKIDKTDSYTVGYMDCTADNIVKLAETYVGTPYGHHGLKNGENNSGMITDICRTMGIILPRDADEIQTAIRLLPTKDEIFIISADGENALAVTHDGGITVIGKMAGSKTIDTYTIDGETIGGEDS